MHSCARLLNDSRRRDDVFTARRRLFRQRTRACAAVERLRLWLIRKIDCDSVEDIDGTVCRNERRRHGRRDDDVVKKCQTIIHRHYVIKLTPYLVRVIS